jgi:hypothetical protein
MIRYGELSVVDADRAPVTRVDLAWQVSPDKSRAMLSINQWRGGGVNLWSGLWPAIAPPLSTSGPVLSML